MSDTDAPVEYPRGHDRRERAHAIVYWLEGHLLLGDKITQGLTERITAALDAEAREAREEQMERDCKAVCRYCREGTELQFLTIRFTTGEIAYQDWYHVYRLVMTVCSARYIRAAHAGKDAAP